MDRRKACSSSCTTVPSTPRDSHPCTILGLVAGRAAAELERSRVEAQLRQQRGADPVSQRIHAGAAVARDARWPARLPVAARCRVLRHVNRLAARPRICGLHASRRCRAQAAAVDLARATRAAVRSRVPAARRGWHLSLAADSRAARARCDRRDHALVRIRRRRGRPAARRGGACARPIAARTSSSPCWRTSCGIRSRRSATPSTCRPGPATTSRSRARCGRPWSGRSEHLVRLVDDLLDVSRLTTGQITLRRAAGRCARHCRRRPRDLPRDVRREGPPRHHALSPVDALHGRRRSHPARPGRDQRPEQRRQVHRARRGDRDRRPASRDGAIEIRVRDTGVGISADRLPRIFDLFLQSDPSPDRAHGGLGVGLTLARRLVDLHAGTLTASSAGAGCGSEFRIALPRATARPRPSMHPQRHSQRARTPARTAARARHRRLRGRHARARTAPPVMGHEVIIAHDGKSGIELAERLRPDVILLDIGLPEMDGYSVARHLRSLPTHRRRASSR